MRGRKEKGGRVTQISLRLRGRVQGVSFRVSAKRRAELLGITGWARNDVGGTLSIYAEGEEEAVEGFVAWCRMGPQGAHVKGFEEERSYGERQYAFFEIRI